jgi:hypothetical protein
VVLVAAMIPLSTAMSVSGAGDDARRGLPVPAWFFGVSVGAVPLFWPL